MNKYLTCTIFIILLGACARAPIKSIDQAMRRADTPKNLIDDMGLFDLAQSLKANIERLKTYGDSSSPLRFGAIQITKATYLESLEYLLEALKADASGELFLKIIKNEYEFYEVYGGDEGWGEVFVTSYFEPVIKGSQKKVKPYTQAIYGVPKNMIIVNLSEFSRVFPTLKPYQEAVIEQKSRDGALRGRLINSLETGSVSSVVPYYSREEIDEQNMIKNEAEVLCYVDPVDAFFLQIQGSGQVELSNGEVIKLGYAGQNGHTYKAIGKALFNIIPKEEMSAQKIANYLRSISLESAQKIMSLNPSYIFFQKQKTNPMGSFGAEVIPGRTIATDQKYFPKGALAYLEYERPMFDSIDAEAPKYFSKSARFVLDQDTGGAIRGPHRVDLFWGRGAEAAQVSGVMRNPGRLYYILPKKRAL